MSAIIDLLRHPDVDAGAADWLDLQCWGLTPLAVLELVVGGTPRGETTVQADGTVSLVGDPGAGGNGIPVSPGGMRNNLSEFQHQRATFTVDPAPSPAGPVNLLVGAFGGNGVWAIRYKQEV